VAPAQRPFLKWAGNKHQIAAYLQAAVQEVCLARGVPLRRYVEPFIGSAAAFLSLPIGFERYVLADFNTDLVHLYSALLEHGETFIRLCEAEFQTGNHAEGYYARRDEFNACTDPVRRATLFVYLNRHGFNGLCRYNARGGFNVPFGRYKAPYFPRKEMEAFRAACAGRDVEFRCGSFEDTLGAAESAVGAGDLVYCDPPYAPLDQASNFTGYAQGGFGLDLQLSLARHAERLAQAGAWVIVSNHDTALTRALYDGSAQSDDVRRAHAPLLNGWLPTHGRILGSFDVQRFISANGSRNKAPELLAIFGPDVAASEVAGARFRHWLNPTEGASSAQGR
jgi:DNA adenine methylase